MLSVAMLNVVELFYGWCQQVLSGNFCGEQWLLRQIYMFGGDSSIRYQIWILAGTN